MSTKLSFISLGCDKNFVDSEVMLGLVKQEGYEITSVEEEAEVIIVNTCCFIKDALNESIETIIETAEYKKYGKLKVLIVSGCLSERYKEEIFKEIPEVDAILGTVNYTEIVNVIEKAMSGEKISAFSSIDLPFDEKNYKREISGISNYAYLKIAEGCDNHCTYCVIPSLRGKYRSRSVESILNEAKNLANQGIEEMILVAQDTSAYGMDIGESLAGLIQKLCSIEEIRWIRILYCYPENITDELISIMSKEDKVCKYIDMPIQHGVSSVLKRMGRKGTADDIKNTVSRLRKEMPSIAIRTTIITGFPQETEEEFTECLSFIKELKFDRLGVFTYSDEEGTPAQKLKGKITKKIKENRKEMLMQAQQTISEEKNKALIGEVLTVVISGYLPEDKVYVARSYKDAPDIDGLIFVKSKYELLSGTFLNVLVTNAYAYDLEGILVYDEEQ